MHVWYVIASGGLRVREDHRRSARQTGSLLFGQSAFLLDHDVAEEDGFTWGHITGGVFNGDWIATGKVDPPEMFVSRFPLP
jgi:hypothetical protein